MCACCMHACHHARNLLSPEKCKEWCNLIQMLLFVNTFLLQMCLKVWNIENTLFVILKCSSAPDFLAKWWLKNGLVIAKRLFWIQFWSLFQEKWKNKCTYFAAVEILNFIMLIKFALRSRPTLTQTLFLFNLFWLAEAKRVLWNRIWPSFCPSLQTFSWHQIISFL